MFVFDVDSDVVTRVKNGERLADILNGPVPLKIRNARILYFDDNKAIKGAKRLEHHLKSIASLEAWATHVFSNFKLELQGNLFLHVEDWFADSPGVLYDKIAEVFRMTSTAIVNKVWNFCHTLRDDGVGYGDYLEQLTYLLFLKMAHEYSKSAVQPRHHIPKGFDWASLRTKSGEPSWRPLPGHCCTSWARRPGMLGAIFVKARTRSQTRPSCALVQLIDAESWVSWTPTPRATCTRACCRRTPRTPRAARASTSRRAP
jgi:hypothetical protein